MQQIPEEVLQILEKFYHKFIADTIEPRSVIKDGLGQFIAVGKLKNLTFQHGSNVDIVTTRIVSLKDGLDVKESRIDLAYDVFEKYKQCCEDVLNRWND